MNMAWTSCLLRIAALFAVLIGGGFGTTPLAEVGSLPQIVTKEGLLLSHFSLSYKTFSSNPSCSPRMSHSGVVCASLVADSLDPCSMTLLHCHAWASEHCGI